MPPKLTKKQKAHCEAVENGTAKVERLAKPKGKQLAKVRTRAKKQEALLKQVRYYQGLMKMRIHISNQISAMERQALMPDDKADEIREEMVKPRKKEEGQLVRIAAKNLKGMPVWEEWLKHVDGIGETLAIQFVALIQPIGDFANVAKLWAYAGLSVDDDGRAQRRKKGVQSNWNTALKTLCYQAAECFVRQVKKDENGEVIWRAHYRTIYDRYKARDKGVHPEKVKAKNPKRDGGVYYDYTDGHMHKRAMRYTVKLFLSHLWQVWREFEGLSVRGPYAIEVLGHDTIISPWSMIEKPGESES